MTTFLADLSQRDMQRRLSEALRVYVIAMGYPHGTEDQRAPMWLEHSRRPGWQAAAIFDTPAAPSGITGPAEDLTEQARIVGIAYGYRGAADQWWHQQVSQGLRKTGLPRDRINALLNQYFELTELHVDPGLQGHGYGEALARRLLAGRTESHVLLSTPEISGESNRAWRLYRRLGFTDVIRQHQFAGDPRRFAVLGRALPWSPDIGSRACQPSGTIIRDD
ncbi:acetyltransferase family protein [Mycobacteroides abscessus MAB_091912_2446]|uniref:Acetyltransferase family protein n=2 Tax=Mycobacteroides abscessus TaxID=36809 RepID=A0A829M7T7_9MYCO|nr:acetyltransferase family protein [Mycobacteroides abscessus MAB_091912_2446]